jgi:hypothetical protein
MWCVLMGIGHPVWRDGALHLRQSGGAFGGTDPFVEHRGVAGPVLGLAGVGRNCQPATLVGGAVVLVAILFNAYSGVRRLALA